MTVKPLPSPRWDEIRGFFRRSRAWLAIVLTLSLYGTHAIDSRGPLALIVEMRADTPGSAQLFYDLGDGFTEPDSATSPVAGTNSYTTLQFALPRYKIHSFRFDPMSGRGTFSIRRAYVIDAADRVVKEFAAADLIANNQIAARTEAGPEVTFTTAADASDPSLRIGQAEPVEPAWLSSATVTRLLLPAGIAVLTALAIGAAAFALGQLAWPRRLLDRLAATVSDATFVVVDRFAVACGLAIALFFVVFVAAGFNGSSISLYGGLSNGEGAQPLLGMARPIRSDEWAVHTPAILNQVFRAKSFDVDWTAVGPHAASLIANIPVRHFTTLLRPQFWGFFALPPAYGFAFYWQFKALLLFGGVFALLLVLTRSSRLAAFGALWYGSSSYTQWTYSWPSLLPEMVGLFCIVMVSLFYMTVGRRRPLLLAAAVSCVACAVNFALCAYIPHQIPLVWLGVALCAWWAWANRQAIFTREFAAARVAALSATAFFIALVMFGFYRDAEPTIHAAANTIYPGQRILSGGHYQLTMFFSHFFAYWTDDRMFPLRQAFGNICESAGFFWLAPISAFVVIRATAASPYVRGAYAMLALFGAWLFAWLALPLPDFVGSITLMNKSGVGRSMHVLGLVNVALVAVALGMHRGGAAAARRPALGLAVAVFATLFPAMLLINASLSHFLTAGQTTLVSVYFTLVIVALLEAKLAPLAALLIVPQFVVFGLVNPLDRGLQVIESAPLFKFVQARPELLRQRWIVFSDSFTHSDFFSAIGCEVITGLRYIPDLDGMSVFEPTADERDVLNRSGLFIARPSYVAPAVRFEQLAVHTVLWHVDPLDARLKQLGTRYAAFTTPPPAHVAARLRRLSDVAVSGFWLYELPE